MIEIIFEDSRHAHISSSLQHQKLMRIFGDVGQAHRTKGMRLDAM